MKLKLAFLGWLIALMSTSASAQGIPVIDAAALAQQIQQVVAWGEQYRQMVEHYQRLGEQLNAIKGARGMGQLLNTAVGRQVVPQDFVAQFESLRSLGSAGASPAAAAIYNSIKTFGCSDQFPRDQQARLRCEATAMATPQNAAFINQSLATSRDRVSQLQGLISQIDSADDIKAAQDLGNRIQAETALLQNEKMMMDLALASYERQVKLLEQQKKEAGVKRLTEPGSNPFTSSR